MGKMLIGQFNNKIDTNFRVSIPSKLLTDSNEVIIVQGFEECLYIFYRDDFDEFLAKLNSLSFTKTTNRDFARLFLANAYSINIDAKGRITIPDSLVKFAKLDSSVTFIGTGSRIEVWNSQSFEKYANENAFKLEKIANEVDL